MLELVQDVTARIDLPDLVANKSQEVDMLRARVAELQATVNRQRDMIDRFIVVQGLDKEEISSLRSAVKRWERRANQYEAIATGAMKMVEEKA